MSNPYIDTEPKYYKSMYLYLQAINNGLRQGLVFPDWSTVQSNQPTIQALQDKMVYWNVVSKRRIGVQGTNLKQYTALQNSWWNNQVWYESWLIQVSAFMNIVPTDSYPSDSAEDVITQLQAYVNNPHGLSYYLKQDVGVDGFMQVVRSTDIRDIDYENDSGLKQKFPQFDFEIIVKNISFFSQEVVADLVDGETHPV